MSYITTRMIKSYLIKIHDKYYVIPIHKININDISKNHILLNYTPLDNDNIINNYIIKVIEL